MRTFRVLRNRLQSRRAYLALPLAIFIAGVISSLLIFLILQRSEDQKQRLRLNNEADVATVAVRQRIDAAIALLRGGSGLFVGNLEVTPDEFRVFMRQVDIEANYQGMLGVGFSRRIGAQSNVAAFEAEMRVAGKAGFTVWPERSPYERHAIVFQEPDSAQNRLAIGYDMFSDEVRREAMQRASVSGEPAATARVTLVQEIDPSKQPGFIIVVPVYGRPVGGNSLLARGSLRGFIYTPLRAVDFLGPAIPQYASRSINVSVFDGEIDSDKLMFETAPSDPFAELRATRTVDVAGRRWRIVATPSPQAAGTGRMLPIVAGLAGVLATLVVAGASYHQARQRERVERTRRSLAMMNAQLEERVRTRTEQLETANRTLRAEIAGREAAEAELRQAQKMEALGRLTGGIAHDFNNMLSVISGGIELALRRLAKDAEGARRHLGMAREGVDRAAELTSRLLSFSRQKRLQPKPTALHAIVEDMTEILRRSLGEQIVLETGVEPGLWSVTLDRGEMENALLNLALNARDALPEGGRLSIDCRNVHVADAKLTPVSEIPAGDYVVVAIGDNGVGMDADTLAHVFEPFFTTKDVGKGTGLGLSQVYGFVTDSQGYIDIKSSPGAGTEVALYFPRGREAAQASRRRPADGAAQGARPGETILVVEDDDKVRAVTTQALRDLGYTVLEAGSGAAAVDIIRSERRIDLLFSDVVMPMTTGPKLARLARTVRPRLKVVYATGYASRETLNTDMVGEDADVLLKPVRLDDLGSRIRARLDG